MRLLVAKDELHLACVLEQKLSSANYTAGLARGGSARLCTGCRRRWLVPAWPHSGPRFLARRSAQLGLNLCEGGTEEFPASWGITPFGALRFEQSQPGLQLAPAVRMLPGWPSGWPKERHWSLDDGARRFSWPHRSGERIRIGVRDVERSVRYASRRCMRNQPAGLGACPKDHSSGARLNPD